MMFLVIFAVIALFAVGGLTVGLLLAYLEHDEYDLEHYREVWWCETHGSGLGQTDIFPPDTCWSFTADADSCLMVGHWISPIRERR